jgi:hypothetical protein
VRPRIFRRLGDPPFLLFGGRLGQGHGEGHVLGHGHMRVERIVLEHHGNVPCLGGQVVHHLVPDPDRAFGNVFQPGNHAQQGGLATAGGADQNHKFAVLDIDRHAMHNRHATVGLLDVFNAYWSHGALL